ncbi:MAG: amidohydrolase [Burkholderiales bacterium]|nr:amidohydrolase [Burkholderiales bacterium]
MAMIIDVRCRPPLPEFREYFDIPRITWHGRRTGAKEVSRAFCEGSMALYLEEMAQAGIDLAVVQGRNSPEVFMGKKFNAAFIRNERIAELQSNYPGRFMGLGGIDPSNTAHDAVRETERCVRELGLKGIFVEPGRALQSHPDDPRMYPIYEKCIELDVAINLMSGPYAGPDIETSNPLYVDRVATRYPDLRILLGHGGYPFVQEVLGVAFKHVNVYVSPDMYIFAPGGKAYVEAANGSLRDQIVYGSAYPLRPLVQTVADNRNLGFEASVLSQYFSDNAKRIFKL